MKSLVDQLSQYAAYHRDPRNIATHFVGIPLIVVAVVCLLSRPGHATPWGTLSLAWAVSVVVGVYYVALDRRLGLLMAVLLAAACAFGAELAAQGTGQWLGVSLGLFVAGWVIQFVGHYFEGRKPAFVDDLMGLAIGPLFVVAEACFLLGLRTPLREAIEARVGPTRRREPAATQAGVNQR